MEHVMLFEQFLLEKNPMEVTSKDDMRINDIIRKSGGDKAKAEALARTMASRITDFYKAVRRSSAAARAGRADLAQIFKERSMQLNEELIEESDMGPVKMGSMFVKKEGKSQMNGKKGMFDAVEGDTLKITGVMDDGKEFRGVVQSKYGNDQVLVSSSQLKSWERTK